MIVRAKQLQVIQEALGDQYVADIAPKIRRLYPESTYRKSDLVLRGELAALVKEAARFELTDARPVSRYIAYHYEYGAGFPKSSDWEWAHEILLRQDLDADNKIAKIDELLVGGPLWPVTPMFEIPE